MPKNRPVKSENTFLQQAYYDLHTNPKYFPGYSIQAHIPALIELVAKHRPESLLDYGCGKGYQYLKRRVHELWGGPLPYCYDFAVPHISEKPTRVFDGVICTDMLEHVEESEVDAIVAEICGYATKFAFFAIHTSASENKKHKNLPDGRDLHITVRPPGWWEQKFAPHRARIDIVTAYGAE
jgi:hypothetical protein